MPLGALQPFVHLRPLPDRIGHRLFDRIAFRFAVGLATVAAISRIVFDAERERIDTVSLPPNQFTTKRMLRHVASSI